MTPDRSVRVASLPGPLPRKGGEGRGEGGIRGGRTLCLFLLLLVGGAIPLSGCAPSREIVRVQDETRAKVLTTEQQIESLRRNQADLATRLEALQFEIQRLTGKFEERTHRDQQESKEWGDTREGLKREIKDLKEEIGRLKERSTALETALLTQKSVPPGPTPGPETKPSERHRDPTTAYRDGVELYKEGKYEKARDVFRGYLKTHPKGDLSDNAQFWIGETYYAQGDFENAILAYEELASRYPKSDKMPAAILKEGLAFLELKDSTNAKLLLNRLIKKYPKSDEAKLAQRKLKTIK